MKEQHRQRFENENGFKAILNYTPVGIRIIKNQGHIELANGKPVLSIKIVKLK